MRVWFYEGTVVLVREEGDPKFYGVKNAAGESRLLYYAKQFLNKRGFNLIKKRMWKDGHLVDDLQQYLRPRGRKRPHIYISSWFWAIHGAEVPWNECGTVNLRLTTDVYKTGQDTISFIKHLCEKHEGIEWRGE